MVTTPTCTSGTTITCADNSTRFNNVSTAYNGHSHTDLTRTTSNTWTVGDGLAGNKQFCDSSTNSRCFQHQSVANLWTMQQSGTTYDQLLTATGTAGLSVNAVLLGNGTASLANVSGLGTSGQLLTSNGSGSAPTWQAAPAATDAVSGRVYRTAGDVTIATATLTDFTGASVTITTGANPVLIGFLGAWTPGVAGNSIVVDFAVDGTSVIGSDFTNAKSATTREYITPVFLTAAQTAAAHTFKMQWARNGSGTDNMDCDATGAPCEFFAVEVR